MPNSKDDLGLPLGELGQKINRVVVQVPSETWDVVRATAKKNRRTVSEVAVKLMEMGIEALREQQVK